jgi:hypothetical protein
MELYVYVWDCVELFTFIISQMHLVSTFFLSITIYKYIFLQVYAVMSFLSLVLPRNAIYFNSIREM